jgi:GT2 family glycosyltransferase
MSSSPSSRTPAEPVGAGPSRPAASLVVVLDGGATRALRCFESIAALDAHQPAHEIVVVDNAAADLAPLLARLDGDVTVVRSPRREGFAAAAALGAARCRGNCLVLLRDAPLVAPDFLAPLLAALADPACAAAAAAPTVAPAPGPAAVAASAVTTHALALRRADLGALDAVPASTPAPLALAALCLALAHGGAVRLVSTSVVAPPGARSGGLRRTPGEPIELSIVIPTLDAASDRTRRCVAAAQATTDVAHELIVVDNGAPPQGFTAPVNAGLRAARGRYLLVLNDDVELLPGWWEPLRDALDTGAAVAFPDTVEGAMRHDFAAWCFALTREALERFAVADDEFLDPELVVWYQDTDLLERLRRAGRPPLHVPASRIRHGLSETVASDDPALRAWIATQVERDRAAFEAKLGTGVAGAAR